VSLCGSACLREKGLWGSPPSDALPNKPRDSIRPPASRSSNVKRSKSSRLPEVPRIRRLSCEKTIVNMREEKAVGIGRDVCRGEMCLLTLQRTFAC